MSSKGLRPALSRALETVAAAANVGAGRLVVVDAIDERAHGFYAHYGLTSIAGGLRLFARIDAVSASIAHAVLADSARNLHGGIDRLQGNVTQKNSVRQATAFSGR